MTTLAPGPGGGGPESHAKPGADEYVGEEMTLFEHLRELRDRLFRSAIAVVAGFAVGFVFRQPVFDLLIEPYCELPSTLRAGSSAFNPDNCTLIFTDVMGAFFISLKAAAVIAIVLAGPVVAYQLWRFITPGLRPIERRYALPFIVASAVLFAAGAVFAYVSLPLGLEVLLSFAGDNVVSLMDANRYLGFLLNTTLGFGLAFQFPLILLALVLSGVVGVAGLRAHRRHAIFGTFVAAAIITPQTDPISMTVLALPLILMYEGCVLVAKFVERRRNRHPAIEA
jgi:sec-independent protein translocase protein TatC